MTRVRSFLAEESGATGLPIGALILVAAVLHITVALFAVNPWHPDEHFQVLEFAWARAGFAPLTGLPWEFAAKIRPALQPTLAMGALAIMRALGITSPFAWTTALRIGTLAAAFVVLIRALARVSPSLSVRGRRLLWVIGLLLWFFPLFAFRFSSENLGGLTLAAALTFVGTESSVRNDRWLAALLGLSFEFRFQMAFAIVALLLWIAVYGSGGVPRAARIACGILVIVAAGTLVDSWFYHAWVFTPWEYFHVNLVEGVAATFGASPWYSYFVWAPLWMAPPLGIVLVGLFLTGMASRPHSPWSWCAAGFLCGHLLVAHKELRFLFPLLYFVPVLVAYGWDALERKVPMTGGWRAIVWCLGAQNVVLALILATPSIHRGKEFDWHYFRFLWNTAESHPGQTVFVLNTDGSPYRVWNWDANVFRHSRILGVNYTPGDSLPAVIPRGTPPEDILVVKRTPGPPNIAGPVSFTEVYEAEAGYRIMGRWFGMENSAVVRQLEEWDRWTNSEWVRRVYQVHVTWSP